MPAKISYIATDASPTVSTDGCKSQSFNKTKAKVKAYYPFKFWKNKATNFRSPENSFAGQIIRKHPCMHINAALLLQTSACRYVNLN